MKRFILLAILLFSAATGSAQTAAPAKTAAVPAKTEAVPAKTEAAPAKTETAKTETKARPIRYIYHGGLRYVLLYDVADFYKLSSYYTKDGVVLYSAAKRIKMYYKSRLGSINGTAVYFLKPMLYLNKQPYITEYDFLKVIDSAIRKKMAKRHKLRTIMLDPGHGGKDAGAPGPVLSEKQINLLIAQKMKKSLEILGFKVIMTRNGDTFPSLAERSAMCKKYKPDLYISIHCNASGTKSVDGIETYLLTPPKAASTADTNPQSAVYTGNSWDSNNYRLAYEIQRGLLKFTKANDRGVRHARFAVLKHATAPAVLIECGFLSNNAEGKKLATNEQQNKIVAGILNGIARYAATLRQK